MQYYELKDKLVINHTDGTKVTGTSGQIAYVNSDGCLAICEKSEVEFIEARVDAEIAKNIADAEAWEAAHPEPTPEEP